MAEVSAALVHDTTVFGPTGPLLGSRYRLEVAPARGQLSYTSVTADVRKYLMPVRPYSIALRLLHSARYGADGSDPRLLSNFLGSSYFVRGHREDLAFCRPDTHRVCGDDLLGINCWSATSKCACRCGASRSRQIDYGLFPPTVRVRRWRHDQGERAERRRSAASAAGCGSTRWDSRWRSPRSARSTARGRAGSSISGSGSGSDTTDTETRRHGDTF